MRLSNNRNYGSEIASYEKCHVVRFKIRYESLLSLGGDDISTTESAPNRRVVTFKLNFIEDFSAHCCRKFMKNSMMYSSRFAPYICRFYLRTSAQR